MSQRNIKRYGVVIDHCTDTFQHLHVNNTPVLVSFPDPPLNRKRESGDIITPWVSCSAFVLVGFSKLLEGGLSRSVKLSGLW